MSGLSNGDSSPGWFCVRCVFHIRDSGAYEERITLWKACTPSEAISLAESEAAEYADALGEVGYVGRDYSGPSAWAGRA